MKRSDYIWVTLFTTLIWVLKISTVVFISSLPPLDLFMWGICGIMLFLVDCLFGAILIHNRNFNLNNVEKILMVSSPYIIVYITCSTIYHIYLERLKSKIKTLNNWINNEKEEQ